MRILYLSQYFPPEAGATQTRAFEMARNFVRRGHEVCMICEFPNHPSGIIPPAYRRKLYELDELEGIQVIRVWVKASPEKNFSRRMLFYLSFMINAFLAGIFLARGHYDLIYATSPPLFVGGAALGLSFLRRIPLVFEVRDLWPESAIALGELQNRSAIALATRLELACYHRARKIIAVTLGIITRLTDRGIPPAKLVCIPNGANTEMFRYDETARQHLRQDMGLQDSYVVIYAGIFGIAQGLDTVVQAAQLLSAQPEIAFLLIGEGPEKVHIKNLIDQLNLNNVHILPEQLREKIPDFLSAADVAVIPLKNLDLFKGALPSKMFDAWACNRPILVSIDGEARQVLDKAGGGVFVPPEDAAELARQILYLKENPTAGAAMGLNGRLYTEQNHSRQALAQRLLDLLQTI
jgi:glycosyltransferase involved in cell wall biosynthesis